LDPVIAHFTEGMGAETVQRLLQEILPPATTAEPSNLYVLV